MNIEDIKQQLSIYERKFPEAAVRAAMEQREAMTPILLDCLQETADDPWMVAENEDGMLQVYAMYLLAQFRERAAYPMLVKLFSTPGEVCFDLAGDVVTDGLDRILATLYDGDVDSIKRMIENREVNEYVRSTCMRVLVTLVAWGDLEREAVVEYFRSLFDGRLERDADFLWGSLVSSCCDLYPEELLPDIERAFADDLVDTFYIGMDSVEESMAQGKEQAIRQGTRHGPIEDTVAEMSWWAYFKEEEPKTTIPVPAISQGTRVKAATPAPVTAQRTLVKAPKVGRNDPCPCGSGKKFKKCCGR
nr:DUF1186 domain-containing protein [Thiocystis minor]